MAEPPFSGLSREILEALAVAVSDRRLSLESRAALVFVAVEPAAIDLTIPVLAKDLRTSRERMRRIVAELIDAGYLEHRIHRDRGRFVRGEHRLAGALGRASETPGPDEVRLLDQQRASRPANSRQTP